MTQPVLLSLGSVNADFQVRTDAAPGSAETLAAHDLRRLSGGKAANVALLALRLGHGAQALHTDIGPGASASSHEGVHLGAMAGAWDVLQRFYLGLRLEHDKVLLEPHPPAALDAVRTAVWLQGRRLALHLRGRHLHAALEPGAAPALTLWYRGEPLRLAPGGTRSLACR